MQEYRFGEIFVVSAPIAVSEIARMAEVGFGDMVKAVVDIEKNIMALNAELHADEEALLIQQGSRQSDLWGVNLYPEKFPDDWIEFNSMVNIRPSQGNRSRNVEDPQIREQIRNVIQQLVV